MKNYQSYQCISKFKLEKLQINYAGKDGYFITAIITYKINSWTVFADVEKSVYLDYRYLCYVDPPKAKELLFDQLSFEGLPFSRIDFRFVRVGSKLEEENIKFLKKFALSL